MFVHELLAVAPIPASRGIVSGQMISLLMISIRNRYVLHNEKRNNHVSDNPLKTFIMLIITCVIITNAIIVMCWLCVYVVAVRR